MQTTRATDLTWKMIFCAPVWMPGTGWPFSSAAGSFFRRGRIRGPPGGIQTMQIRFADPGRFL